MLFTSEVRRLVLYALLSFVLAGKDPSGAYQGDWSGGSASGELRMNLRKAEDKWTCEAVFTLGAQEVKTAMKSIKVDEGKVEIEYEFDLQGNILKSTLTGQLTEQQDKRILEGKYHTVVAADGSPVDEGVWKVTAKP